MRYLLYSLSLLLLLGVFACQEPIDFTFDSEPPKLVISGLLTDKVERQNILIEYSRQLKDYSTPEYIFDALVTVVDKEGNIYSFTYYQSGLYRSRQSFAIQPNTEYQLTVRLSNGFTYQSDWQRIPQKNNFTNFRYAYEYREKINQFGIIVPDHRLVGLVDNQVSGPAYYLWRNHSIYEVETPALTDTLLAPGSCLEDECPCCRCWVFESLPTFELGTNQGLLGDEFNNQKAADIEIVGPRFYFSYMFIVEQYTLTPEAYTFWKNIKEGIDASQGLFSSIPPKAIGNINNLDDPDERVLGYFALASYASDSIFVDKYDLPIPIQQDTVLAESCESYGNSTILRPNYWQ